jgi:hypothetical protein
VVDCAPDEPRGAAEPYEFVQRASGRRLSGGAATAPAAIAELETYEIMVAASGEVIAGT